MRKNDTLMTPAQKGRAHKTLMNSFYRNNQGALLSELMRNGYDHFTRAFADLHLSKARSDVTLEPEVIASAFRGHFIAHMDFRDFAKAFCEEDDCFKQVNAKNIDLFIQTLRADSKFADFENKLSEDEIRIICLCLTDKSSKRSAASIAEMFPGNGHTLAEIEAEALAVPDASTLKPAKKSRSTPETEKIRELIRNAMENRKNSGETTALSTPEVRELILKTDPSLMSWIDANKHKNWLSARVSESARNFSLSTTFTHRKSSGKEEGAKSAVPKIRVLSGMVRILKDKTPEQLEALAVIDAVQGQPTEAPKFWSGPEMIALIIERLPHLEKWIAKRDNRRWVRNSLGNLKRSILRRTTELLEADQSDLEIFPDKPSEPVAMKPQASASKSPEQSSIPTILEEMERFQADLESGVVLPRDVLLRGAELEQRMAEFENQILRFDQLRGSIQEMIVKYQQLGIKL